MRTSLFHSLASILSATAIVLGLSTRHVQAGVISTSLVNSGGTCSDVCWVTNIGTKNVKVNSVKVFDEAGNEATIVSNNCTFPGEIFPNLTCAVHPNGSIIQARCVIDTASPKQIRAAMVSFCNAGIDRSEAR